MPVLTVSDLVNQDPAETPVCFVEVAREYSEHMPGTSHVDRRREVCAENRFRAPLPSASWESGYPRGRPAPHTLRQERWMFIRPCLAIVAVVGLAASLFSQDSEGVPPDLAEAVQRTLREERCRLVPDGEGVWMAADPDRAMSARFSADGVEVAGEAESGEVWSLGFELIAWGREEELTSVQDGSCVAIGTRFEIQRGDLTEWYVNSEHGTEQGFTLAAPPPGTTAGDDPLRLVLEIEGGFSGEILDGGRDASFSSRDGAQRVLYGGLRAWDTDGRQLDAHLACKEGQLSILVDDCGAAYPLTVDPWIWIVGVPLRREFGRWTANQMGRSVAIDGLTVLVGVEYDNALGTDSGAAYVFTRSGSEWTLQAQLTASDGAPDDRFGWSVSLDGHTALIGAIEKDDLGIFTGAAYVFMRNGTEWTQQAKLLASDASSHDYFGTSVALEGDTALVGATGRRGPNQQGGAVYSFSRTGTLWLEDSVLVAEDGEFNDRFGWSVSLDGDAVAIGAYDARGSVVDGAGAAYVFRRNGSLWAQEARLSAANGSDGEKLGWCISIDGDSVIVGTNPGEGYYYPPGSAYVFVRAGSTWSEQAQLVAIGGGEYRQLGYAVAIRDNIAVVGAPMGADITSNPGAAYVFMRSGTSWAQCARLTGANEEPGDRFGAGVAIGGDMILVGIPNEDIGRYRDAGAVGVFVGHDCAWGETDRLYSAPEDNTDGAQYGFSVDLDGNTAIIGAHGDNAIGDACGAAYVFTKDGGWWQQQARLTASDGQPHDRFGVSVALRWDSALIGALGHDAQGLGAGAAYLFTRNGTVWKQQEKLLVTGIEGGDGFGSSVALTGNVALVGAFGDDDMGAEAGAAYVFERLGSTWMQQCKLTAPDGVARQRFGYSVAVQGTRAIVGADQMIGGQAYVFHKSDSVWMPEAKLVPTVREPNDRFGISVDVEEDTAVIGANGDDEIGANAGAAYVFRRVGSSWIQAHKLLAENGSGGDEFGRSVCLHRGRILVGAPFHDQQRGSGYVFRQDGSAWAAEAELTGSNYPGYGLPFEFAGYDGALSDGGALLGAPGWGDDPWGWSHAGVAYFYERRAMAHVASRNPSGNPDSYQAVTSPKIGYDYEAAIDLGGTTGHSLAVLAGYSSPMTFVLAGGQTGLVDASGLELLGFPTVAGPTALFEIPIPYDLTYLGLEVYTQAAHVGGVQPFALSNAQDLFIGY